MCELALHFPVLTSELTCQAPEDDTVLNFRNEVLLSTEPDFSSASPGFTSLTSLPFLYLEEIASEARESA